MIFKEISFWMKPRMKLCSVWSCIFFPVILLNHIFASEIVRMLLFVEFCKTGAVKWSMFNKTRNKTSKWSIQSTVLQWHSPWHSQLMPYVATQQWNSNPLGGEAQLLQDKFVRIELQPWNVKKIWTCAYQEIKTWGALVTFVFCSSVALLYLIIFLYMLTSPKQEIGISEDLAT